MIKIGVLDKSKSETIRKLLQNICTNLPVQICDGLCKPLDVLIIDKIPKISQGVNHPSQKVIIANSDDSQVLQFVSAMGAQIITYGFNPKAAITASSHNDDIFVICIQRAMTTIQGIPLLPREFSITIKNHEAFDECIMGTIATALICGANFD